MQTAEAVDDRAMSKSKKELSGDEQAMKPEMHALIARFDAKDRRDEEAKKPIKKSHERRRRGDKPARAA
jgi:hypothetical protein